MLKVHLPSINPRETSIITCINIVPFSKVQTHSNFKTLSKLKFLKISLVVSRLSPRYWPGYKLPSSRSRTPSDRFCSPACCASGTRTWLGTSSSDTQNTLATKRDFIWVGVQSSSCRGQCPQLRCGLQGITFGFQDYWDKAWESQYLTDALCPLWAVWLGVDHAHTVPEALVLDLEWCGVTPGRGHCSPATRGRGGGCWGRGGDRGRGALRRGARAVALPAPRLRHEEGAEPLGVWLGDQPALGRGDREHAGELEGGQLGRATGRAEDLQLVTSLKISRAWKIVRKNI